MFLLGVGLVWEAPLYPHDVEGVSAIKKAFVSTILISLVLFGLTGCSQLGNQHTSISVIYAMTAVLSLLPLAFYLFWIRERDQWFILLFSSVLVINIGYYALSVSTGLGGALAANRVAYLGSVFLPTSMFMIILNATATSYQKWLPYTLLGISLLVFLVAASPGYLDLYYKEVTFEISHGVGTLNKVYGPLHPLYLLYLISYFAAMITVIVRVSLQKRVSSTAHSVILAISVFVNIGVWFIEQLIDIEFEFLSISYIISESFLLGIHMIMKENHRLKELVQTQTREQETVPEPSQPAESAEAPTEPDEGVDIAEHFTRGLATLTPKEKELFDAYVAGMSTKEILATFNIKENTLKFHNKNLYGKLGVSSRKQLLAVYKQLEEQ